MKLRRYIVSWLLRAFLPLILLCSLPDAIDVARWNMHVEFPVIDRKIEVAALMDQVPRSSTKYLDTSVAGDTIAYTKGDTVGYIFQQALGTNRHQEFSQKLGACTINNTPPISMDFSLEKGLPAAKRNVGEPFSQTTTLSLSKKGYHLIGIREMTVDESSPDLTIKISNNAATAPMEDIVIAILDDKDAIGVTHCPFVAASSAKTIAVSIAGKHLTSPIAVAVCVTLPKGSVIREEDILQLTFSFNGQVISEAVIDDRYLNYAIRISGDVVIADSLRIDRIETGKTALECEITCPAQFRMVLKGSIHNPEQLADGGGKSASSVFVDDTIFNIPYRNGCRMSVPLRAMSLFPKWDSLSMHSSLGFRFEFRIMHDKRLITFNKNDELSIRISPLHFPVNKIVGKFFKPLGYTTIAAVKTGLTAKTASTSALQKCFYFRSARLHMSLEPGLPPGSVLDALIIGVTMKAPNIEEKESTIRRYLTDLRPGVRQEADMDFTGLFNCWPDTFTFDLELEIPPWTNFTLANYHTEEDDAVPMIKFIPSLIWDAVVPLCWSVSNRNVLEMERAEISIADSRLDVIKKLEHPRIKILMNIENQTNINCRIFALGAAEQYADILDSYPDSLVGTEEMQKNLPGNLFVLTGYEGVLIAPRNKTGYSEIVADEDAIDALVSGERCIFRWFLAVPEAETDALKSTDYCRISATGVVEGTANSDTIGTFY